MDNSRFRKSAGNHTSANATWEGEIPILGAYVHYSSALGTTTVEIPELPGDSFEDNIILADVDPTYLIESHTPEEKAQLKYSVLSRPNSDQRLYLMPSVSRCPYCKHWLHSNRIKEHVSRCKYSLRVSPRKAQKPQIYTGFHVASLRNALSAQSANCSINSTSDAGMRQYSLRDISRVLGKLTEGIENNHSEIPPSLISDITFFAELYASSLCVNNAPASSAEGSDAGTQPYCDCLVQLAPLLKRVMESFSQQKSSAVASAVSSSTISTAPAPVDDTQYNRYFAYHEFLERMADTFLPAIALWVVPARLAPPNPDAASAGPSVSGDEAMDKSSEGEKKKLLEKLKAAAVEESVVVAERGLGGALDEGEQRSVREQLENHYECAMSERAEGSALEDVFPVLLTLTVLLLKASLLEVDAAMEEAEKRRERGSSFTGSRLSEQVPLGRSLIALLVESRWLLVLFVALLESSPSAAPKQELLDDFQRIIVGVPSLLSKHRVLAGRHGCTGNASSALYLCLQGRSGWGGQSEPAYEQYSLPLADAVDGMPARSASIHPGAPATISPLQQRASSDSSFSKKQRLLEEGSRPDKAGLLFPLVHPISDQSYLSSHTPVEFCPADTARGACDPGRNAQAEVDSGVGVHVRAFSVLDPFVFVPESEIVVYEPSLSEGDAPSVCPRVKVAKATLQAAKDLAFQIVAVGQSMWSVKCRGNDEESALLHRGCERVFEDARMFVKMIVGGDREGIGMSAAGNAPCPVLGIVTNGTKTPPEVCDSFGSCLELHSAKVFEAKPILTLLEISSHASVLNEAFASLNTALQDHDRLPVSDGDLARWGRLIRRVVFIASNPNMYMGYAKTQKTTTAQKAKLPCKGQWDPVSFAASHPVTLSPEAYKNYPAQKEHFISMWTSVSALAKTFFSLFEFLRIGNLDSGTKNTLRSHVLPCLFDLSFAVVEHFDHPVLSAELARICIHLLGLHSAPGDDSDAEADRPILTSTLFLKYRNLHRLRHALQFRISKLETASGFSRSAASAVPVPPESSPNKGADLDIRRELLAALKAPEFVNASEDMIHTMCHRYKDTLLSIYESAAGTGLVREHLCFKTVLWCLKRLSLAKREWYYVQLLGVLEEAIKREARKVDSDEQQLDRLLALLRYMPSALSDSDSRPVLSEALEQLLNEEPIVVENEVFPSRAGVHRALSPSPPQLPPADANSLPFPASDPPTPDTTLLAAVVRFPFLPLPRPTFTPHLFNGHVLVRCLTPAHVDSQLCRRADLHSRPVVCVVCGCFFSADDSWGVDSPCSCKREVEAALGRGRRGASGMRGHVVDVLTTRIRIESEYTADSFIPVHITSDLLDLRCEKSIRHSRFDLAFEATNEHPDSPSEMQSSSEPTGCNPSAALGDSPMSQPSESTAPSAERFGDSPPTELDSTDKHPPPNKGEFKADVKEDSEERGEDDRNGSWGEEAIEEAEDVLRWKRGYVVETSAAAEVQERTEYSEFYDCNQANIYRFPFPPVATSSPPTWRDLHSAPAFSSRAELSSLDPTMAIHSSAHPLLSDSVCVPGNKPEVISPRLVALDAAKPASDPASELWVAGQYNLLLPSHTIPCDRAAARISQCTADAVYLTHSPHVTSTRTRFSDTTMHNIVMIGQHKTDLDIQTQQSLGQLLSYLRATLAYQPGRLYIYGFLMSPSYFQLACCERQPRRRSSTFRYFVTPALGLAHGGWWYSRQLLHQPLSFHGMSSPLTAPRTANLSSSSFPLWASFSPNPILNHTLSYARSSILTKSTGRFHTSLSSVFLMDKTSRYYYQRTLIDELLANIALVLYSPAGPSSSMNPLYSSSDITPSSSSSSSSPLLPSSDPSFSSTECFRARRLTEAEISADKFELLRLQTAYSMFGRRLTMPFLGSPCIDVAHYADNFYCTELIALLKQYHECLKDDDNYISHYPFGLHIFLSNLLLIFNKLSSPLRSTVSDAVSKVFTAYFPFLPSLKSNTSTPDIQHPRYPDPNLLIEAIKSFNFVAQSLSPPQAQPLENMMTALDELSRLHQLGLCHRDLSPTNIVVLNTTQQPEQPTLRSFLIDLGAVCDLNTPEHFYGNILFASPSIREQLKEALNNNSTVVSYTARDELITFLSIHLFVYLHPARQKLLLHQNMKDIQTYVVEINSLWRPVHLEEKVEVCGYTALLGDPVFAASEVSIIPSDNQSEHALFEKAGLTIVVPDPTSPSLTPDDEQRVTYSLPKLQYDSHPFQYSLTPNSSSPKLVHVPSKVVPEIISAFSVTDSIVSVPPNFHSSTFDISQHQTTPSLIYSFTSNTVNKSEINALVDSTFGHPSLLLQAIEKNSDTILSIIDSTIAESNLSNHYPPQQEMNQPDLLSVNDLQHGNAQPTNCYILTQQAPAAFAFHPILALRSYIQHAVFESVFWSSPSTTAYALLRFAVAFLCAKLNKIPIYYKFSTEGDFYQYPLRVALSLYLLRLRTSQPPAHNLEQDISLTNGKINKLPLQRHVVKISPYTSPEKELKNLKPSNPSRTPLPPEILTCYSAYENAATKT